MMLTMCCLDNLEGQTTAGEALSRVEQGGRHSRNMQITTPILRKALITTIHKFGSAKEGETTNNTKDTNRSKQKISEYSCQFEPFVVKKSGSWNDRKNIIVMVDEAHRTQEGDLGHKMRRLCPMPSCLA